MWLQDNDTTVFFFHSNLMQKRDKHFSSLFVFLLTQSIFQTVNKGRTSMIFNVDTWHAFHLRGNIRRPSNVHLLCSSYLRHFYFYKIHCTLEHMCARLKLAVRLRL